MDSDWNVRCRDICKSWEINRITMTKYLKVFAAEGLLRQKNIGNITFGF